MNSETSGTLQGTVTLHAEDVQTALGLIERLARLVAGGAQRGAPKAAAQRRALAIRIMESRRARGSLLPDLCLDDPIWDMLLQLYCAASSNEVVTVHMLGCATQAPSSNTERWLRYLAERNMVEYENTGMKVGPEVHLSNEGFAKLDAYFGVLLEEQFSGLT